MVIQPSNMNINVNNMNNNFHLSKYLNFYNNKHFINNLYSLLNIFDIIFTTNKKNEANKRKIGLKRGYTNELILMI